MKYWFTRRKLFPAVRASDCSGTGVALIMNDATLFTCCYTVCSEDLYDLLCVINAFAHHVGEDRSGAFFARYLGRWMPERKRQPAQECLSLACLDKLVRKSCSEKYSNNTIHTQESMYTIYI